MTKPPQSEHPIFLVGAERSGTTLLRLMLDSHPELAWVNEFEYAVDGLDGPDWPAAADYVRSLETHRIFRAARYAIDPTLAYPDLIRSFLEQRRARAGKAFVGATVHRHFDRVLRIWPDARFLHLVRDPRDVARSCIGMGWAGNVWTGAERWIEAETLWSRLSLMLGKDRFLELRYETLIVRPEEELRRICEFLGLRWSAEMLEYGARSSYERPDPTLVEQWRRTLSAREIQLVEERAGNLLGAAGYTASGLPAIRVGTLARARLRAQDRAARARFAWRIFGWRLRLADILSRRLRLRSWQRSVALRKNEIVANRIR